MAKSFSHAFGQIIGEVLEQAMEPALKQFADDHSLYLDKKGPRPARKCKKVTWTDLNGNKHDLDFVLEKGGSDKVIGTPVAFIECAWRRYTRHSRNKAQEIQGAVEVLAKTYKDNSPFIGVIIAGEFTQGALKQLRSLGFNIVHFPYETMVSVFNEAGIKVDFNDNTEETDFEKKIHKLKSISLKKKNLLGVKIIKSRQDEIRAFFDSLERSVNRRIAKIIIIPLHGQGTELANIESAMAFISVYQAPPTCRELYKYEIQVHYSNGDRINAEFKDKAGALEFLKTISNGAR